VTPGMRGFRGVYRAPCQYCPLPARQKGVAVWPVETQAIDALLPVLHPNEAELPVRHAPVAVAPVRQLPAALPVWHLLRSRLPFVQSAHAVPTPFVSKSMSSGLLYLGREPLISYVLLGFGSAVKVLPLTRYYTATGRATGKSKEQTLDRWTVRMAGRM